MSKTNENAVKILENKDKFLVEESYSYKDICKMCDMKEYSSGNGRKKQLDTFKELFNLYFPYSSRSSSLIPYLAATSFTGIIAASCAISISDFIWLILLFFGVPIRLCPSPAGAW